MVLPDILEYVVRRDRTVEEIRGPWDESARRDQAPNLTAASVVGHRLDDFLTDTGTRGIYRALIEHVLSGGGPMRFRYRCDAPNVRRFMEMELSLQGLDRVRFRSRTLREEPRQAQPLLDVRVPRSDEFINMCSWCKKLLGEDGTWKAVEDFVTSSDILSGDVLPRLSHGICPDCAADLARLDATAS